MSQSDDLTFVKSTMQLRQLRVGTTFYSSLRLESLPEIEYNEKKWVLEAYVLAEKLAEDTYHNSILVKTPTSSWQMFKEEHQASWWLRWLVLRRPIQSKTERHTLTVKVERYASYPEANIDVSQRLGRPVPYELIQQIRGIDGKEI